MDILYHIYTRKPALRAFRYFVAFVFSLMASKKQMPPSVSLAFFCTHYILISQICTMLLIYPCMRKMHMLPFMNEL